MVLPRGISGSEKIFKFISDEVSDQVWVSLMDQYFPAYQAQNYQNLKRKTTHPEFQKAERAFFDSGLINGWTQEKDSVR
jgi:putative pyruvate formate lyase activating enzyme